MKLLHEAVQHYVDLHYDQFSIDKPELIQVACVDIYGKYQGEILVSHGTIKHQDDTPTWVETIKNPGDDYYLWLSGRFANQLEVGEAFYADTRKLHQLWSRSTLDTHWSIGKKDYPDKPWIGITVVGPRPKQHHLNLYKHILISAYVNDVGLCERTSRYSYSHLDLLI